MTEAIIAMEEAFVSLSTKKCYMPQRYVTFLNKNRLALFLKPVAVDELNRAAIKIISQKMMGTVRGVPAIVGVVLVMDLETGEVLSIMDGEYLTALRTGAASGLATKYFARENAKTVAIFGCGAQGKTQLEAVASVRNIIKVWVFDTMKATAEAFVSEMKTRVNAEMEIAENSEVLKQCDIICTATNSEKPLFNYENLKKGVHINAIGSFKPDMQELDPEILKHSKIFIDQKEACLSESGDFLKPIKMGIFAESIIHGEIGGYTLKNISGRESDDEITVFKSVGVAIQDFVVANRIFEKSLLHNFGTRINLFD